VEYLLENTFTKFFQIDHAAVRTVGVQGFSNKQSVTVTMTVTLNMQNHEKLLIALRLPSSEK
jgi:hypothetical protein